MSRIIGGEQDLLHDAVTMEARMGGTTRMRLLREETKGLTTVRGIRKYHPE